VNVTGFNAVPVSQTGSENWTALDGLALGTITRGAFLTADPSNNRVNINAISDTSNGDIYEITLCITVSGPNNLGVDYRIATSNGQTILSTANRVLEAENVTHDGLTNFKQVTLTGMVRGPDTNPSGTPFFQPQLQEQQPTVAN